MGEHLQSQEMYNHKIHCPCLTARIQTGDWVINISDPIIFDGGTINELTLEVGFAAVNNFPLADWGFPTIPGNPNTCPAAPTVCVYQTQPPTPNPQVGTNEYTLRNFDGCGDATLSYVDTEAPDMCADINNVITRVWTVVDESGNTSTCTQTISLTNIGLSELTLPPDWDGIDDGDPWGFEPYLNCDNACPASGLSLLNWNTLPNGYPSPDPYLDQWGAVRCHGTGRPGGGCGNFNSTYWDHKIEICYGTYKIVRHWIISDWCTGELVEHNQVIEVKDSEAPVVVCPPDVTLGVTGHDCDLDLYELQMPTGSDNCSHVYFTPSVPAGVDLLPVDDNNDHIIDRYFVLNVPIGWYTITWTADDGCGNTSTCDQILHVEDLTPPYAVCESYRQAALSTDGFVKIFADAFDDGSNDNCSDIYFKVLRMDDNNAQLGNPHGSSLPWIPGTPPPAAFSCGGVHGDDFIPVVNRFYDVWFRRLGKILL